jgi:moderate conductance mechanosensitive channel
LLVPRYILLSAPGDGEVAVGSLALARFFFLAFQGVMVVVLWLLGRRSGPCMETLLARSRQHDGLLWRIWPFVHLLLMAAALCIVTLDVLGYRYAARFIWLRALASLSVVLLMRVLLVMLVLRFLRTVVTYVFSIGGRMRQRYPDVEAAAMRYFRLLSLLCHGILIALTATVILELWGLSASWFFTSPLGTKLLLRLLIAAITLGAAMVIVQMSNAFTDYLLQPRTTLQGLIREPSRKLKTLAPLVQTVIKIGAVFAAVLVLLEQLGISTGPILAGVGIFGLAVGFASQSLIKDVINGLFILFEDSLSVGDVVTLRGINGQVEKVTLRAVTLRDLAGTVHVIPNGTIDMIANTTKDYSRYILDVGIAYRENVDEVIGLLRDIDEGMRQDPAYGRDMLEPIEVLGLDRFEESALIIRARLKTRPLHQWRIGREFNRRIKMAFDEHGIEIPFPHRTVLLEVPQHGPQSLLRTTIGSEPTTRQENEYGG